MYTVDQTLRSKRTAAALLALSILPVAAFVLIRQMGLLGMAKMGVMGLAAAALGFLVLLRPRVGIYLLLIYVYAGMKLYLPHIVPVAVMAIIATAVLLGLLRGDRLRLTDGVFWVSVALFGLIALQSMMWAHDLGSAFHAFGRFAKALFLTVLFVQLIDNPTRLWYCGVCIFVGGVVAVVIGFVNLKLGLAVDQSVLGGVNILRFAGTHTNANYAAAIMTSGVPVGIVFVKHVRGVAWKVASAVGIVVLVIGIFATLSRAAIFAFAFVIAGVLAKEIRSKRAFAAMLALLVVVFLSIPQYYWIRVSGFLDMSEYIRKDWSLFQRYNALREAWSQFVQNPLTGVGFNNFAARSGAGVIVRIPPHNMYMDMLSGLGIFGLLAFFGVIYSSSRQLVSGWREQWLRGQRWLGDFSYYLALAIASVLVNGLFGDLHLDYFLWVPIAGSLVVRNLRDELVESRAPDQTLDQ